MRPPRRSGRSAIHNVTKCVGKIRVPALSPLPMAEPKNTSTIQMKRISTVPLTGLGTSAPTIAPTPR